MSEGCCLLVYCLWWEGCPLSFRGGPWHGGWGTPAVGHLETQKVLGQHLGHNWAFSEAGEGEREK